MINGQLYLGAIQLYSQKKNKINDKKKSNTLREIQKFVRTSEESLPFVDLSLSQRHLRGGRTSAAHEHLWSLVVLTTQLREKMLISNSFIRSQFQIQD